MSAPVSVIIPVKNAADRLGPCLGALGEALFEGLIAEVILVDGGSTDEIGEVADAVGARLIQASQGRGPQLAAGAKAAKGNWYLFMHADSVLESGWAAVVGNHISKHSDKAAFFRLRFDVSHGASRAVAAWANWRARWLGLPFGDQGLLVSRALYNKVGGYPEIELMEDVALSRRLSGRMRLLDAEVVTSAERYEQEGWVRRGARNLSIQARYLLGADPSRLAETYRRPTP